MFPTATAVHPPAAAWRHPRLDARTGEVASHIGQLTDVFRRKLPQYSSPRHDNGRSRCEARLGRGGMVAGFYWERHPNGPFATLIRVASTYLEPENYDDDSLRALARRDGDEEMRLFKSELRDALKDPGRLPGDELSDAVEFDHGSDVRFLRWLWHELYGDEPFDADIATRLRALPEPFADRLDRLHPRARFAVSTAASAGDWARALDALLGALVKGGAPVSAAERDELVAMLEAAGRPTEAAGGLAVVPPGAEIPAPL